MSIEQKIGDYIKTRGITLTSIAESTRIPYGSLYSSLLDKQKSRELRSKEFMLVCRALEKSPYDFFDDTNDTPANMA